MNRSDFLFSSPDFIGGMSHTLDMGSTMFVFNDSATPEEADIRALKADWCAVGDDLRGAIDEFKADK